LQLSSCPSHIIFQMSSLIQTGAEKKRHELKMKLEARNGKKETVELSPEETMKLTEERLAELDRQEDKGKTWNGKAFTGQHLGEASTKVAPVKLCKAVDMSTQGTMSAAEKSKLSAMVSTLGVTFTFWGNACGGGAQCVNAGSGVGGELLVGQLYDVVLCLRRWLCNCGLSGTNMGILLFTPLLAPLFTTANAQFSRRLETPRPSR